MGLQALFLLQVQSINQFKIDVNPVHVIIFFAGLLAIALFIIFLNTSKKVQNSRLLKTGAIEVSKVKKVPTAGGGIVAMGGGLGANVKKYALNNSEKTFITEACTNSEIEVKKVFAGSASTDECFHQFYKTIKREADDEDELEGKLFQLFAIRNKIQYYDEAYNAAPDGKIIPRQSRRVSASVPAQYNVCIEEIVKKGFKQEKKLKLDAKVCNCVIVDISSGGCAIKTEVPLKAGSKLKIEFKLNKSKGTALGKVIRVNKTGNVVISHIAFIKILTRSSNVVNSFVYGYDA